MLKTCSFKLTLTEWPKISSNKILIFLVKPYYTSDCRISCCRMPKDHYASNRDDDKMNDGDNNADN